MNNTKARSRRSVVERHYGKPTEKDLVICRECSFEARNGHAMNCSKRTKEIRCPECRRRGNSGTLEKLNDQEKARLKEKLGDGIEGNYWGCDECQFVVAEEYLDLYV